MNAPPISAQRFIGQRTYNSALFIDEGGVIRAIYDKHQLVPFGEYMPFGETMAKFGIHGMAEAVNLLMDKEGLAGRYGHDEGANQLGHRISARLSAWVTSSPAVATRSTSPSCQKAPTRL